MKMKNNQDAILRLQTYITKLKNQMNNPPECRKAQLKGYLAWLQREVDRTEITINKLKLGGV